MKILCGVIVALACFMLAESLICNKCSLSVFGNCLNSANETCSGNSSVCFTARVELDISSFAGFNSQGCLADNSTCGTTSSTFVGVGYNSTVSCCSTDNCNPVTLSSATAANKMTFTAAISATVLATVLSSML